VRVFEVGTADVRLFEVGTADAFPSSSQDNFDRGELCTFEVGVEEPGLLKLAKPRLAPSRWASRSRADGR
jgi:hypothetical protein